MLGGALIFWEGFFPKTFGVHREEILVFFCLGSFPCILPKESKEGISGKGPATAMVSTIRSHFAQAAVYGMKDALELRVSGLPRLEQWHGAPSRII